MPGKLRLNFQSPQKLGYYVKWKGYDDTHNTWVTEHDANAPELIKAFWAKSDEKEKSSRKPAWEPAPKGGSIAAGGESATKKRSRKGSVKAPDKDEAPDERPTKKPRENKTLASASTTANESTENIVIGDMSQHMDAQSWEHPIKMIDTVERVDKRLLLQFYEGKLRWKESIEMVHRASSTAFGTNPIFLGYGSPDVQPLVALIQRLLDTLTTAATDSIAPPRQETEQTTTPTYAEATKAPQQPLPSNGAHRATQDRPTRTSKRSDKLPQKTARATRLVVDFTLRSTHRLRLPGGDLRRLQFLPDNRAVKAVTRTRAGIWVFHTDPAQCDAYALAEHGYGLLEGLWELRSRLEPNSQFTKRLVVKMGSPPEQSEFLEELTAQNEFRTRGRVVGAPRWLWPHDKPPPPAHQGSSMRLSFREEADVTRFAEVLDDAPAEEFELTRQLRMTASHRLQALVPLTAITVAHAAPAPALPPFQTPQSRGSVNYHICGMRSAMNPVRERTPLLPSLHSLHSRHPITLNYVVTAICE
ncbi:hypothetical protein B0H14DRAFT_3885203 [Mycena olivaceomarginata]|nr:hypothetical protein B0H14DRAFT_3885203 [Mycena olivaceomarginata]